LAIELEIELGFGSTVLPIAEALKVAPPQRPLCGPDAFHGDADAGCLAGNAAFFAIDSAPETTPRAMRPRPLSFSLAKMKTASPLAMFLPPYIVFCAVNLKVFCAQVANFGFYHEHHSIEYRRSETAGLSRLQPFHNTYC
jgi:hypothetical protein